MKNRILKFSLFLTALLISVFMQNTSVQAEDDDWGDMYITSGYYHLNQDAKSDVNGQWDYDADTGTLTINGNINGGVDITVKEQFPHDTFKVVFTKDIECDSSWTFWQGNVEIIGQGKDNPRIYMSSALNAEQDSLSISNIAMHVAGLDTHDVTISNSDLDITGNFDEKGALYINNSKVLITGYLHVGKDLVRNGKASLTINDSVVTVDSSSTSYNEVRADEIYINGVSDVRVMDGTVYARNYLHLNLGLGGAFEVQAPEAEQAIKTDSVDSSIIINRTNQMMLPKNGSVQIYDDAQTIMDNEQPASHVLIANPKVSGVSIFPNEAAVKPGESMQFTALTAASENVDDLVLFALYGNPTSPDTFLDQDGLLTIGSDETAKVLSVVALSDADHSKFDVAPVLVQQETVVVNNAQNSSQRTASPVNDSTIPLTGVAPTTLLWPLAMTTTGLTIAYLKSKKKNCD
ncbi:MAG: hypothetical protein LBR25_03425 [Erysipelotrichaceae bacterium]|jgi:hypothetical protein|nr:hypothetical protein [Erysipelotrichaceae bacterium]